MKKSFIFFITLFFLLSGCSAYHYCMGKTIRPGTTYPTVYSLMGKPYLGFGVPQKNTDETSFLFYKIPFDNYLVVNFKGYYVDDPPISIEDKFSLIE
jgi:hypothetical protein